MHPLCKKARQTSTFSSEDLAPRRVRSAPLESSSALITSVFQDIASDNSNSFSNLSDLSERCSVAEGSGDFDEEDSLQASEYLSLAARELKSSSQPAYIARATQLLRLYLQVLEVEQMRLEEVSSVDTERFLVLLLFLEKHGKQTFQQTVQVPMVELGDGIVMSIKIASSKRNRQVCQLVEEWQQKFSHEPYPPSACKKASLLAKPEIPWQIRADLLCDALEDYLYRVLDSSYALRHRKPTWSQEEQQEYRALVATFKALYLRRWDKADAIEPWELQMSQHMRELLSHLFSGQVHFPRDKDRFFQAVYTSYLEVLSIFEAQKPWDSLRSLDRIALLFPLVTVPLEERLHKIFTADRLLLWIEKTLPIYQRLLVELEKKEKVRLQLECNTKLLRRWHAFHHLEKVLERDLLKMFDFLCRPIVEHEEKRLQLLAAVQSLLSPS